jgi:hypothetical protein
MRPSTTLYFSLCFALFMLACGDERVPSDPGSWRGLAPIASGPRQKHAAVALDGKVYVIAGVISANTARAEVYGPQRDAWSEIAPLPLPLNHPNVAAVGDKPRAVGSQGQAVGMAEPVERGDPYAHRRVAGSGAVPPGQSQSR